MRTQGYLAFIVGLCLTAWICLFVSGARQQQIHDIFQRDAERVTRDMAVRLHTYFDMLLALKGMYALDDHIDRAQFHRFVGQLDLARRYPGFQAIQFVRAVPEGQLAPFVAAVRADTALSPQGQPQFHIHPEVARAQHYVIEYTEPLAGNESALGLDIAALAPHRRAVELACDSGDVIASERTVLVQDSVGEPGFVARAPVYRNGAPLATVAQRRAAMVGVVAIVFKVNTLMREVVDPALLRHLHVRIHDSGYLRDGAAMAPGDANLMFDSAAKVGAGRALPGLSVGMSEQVGERRWQLQFDGVAGTRYSMNYMPVLLIGVTGLIVSALVAALLITTQRRLELTEQLRLALDEQRALQDSAIVGICLVAGGVILRCNRGLEEMSGYGAGLLAGRPSALLSGDAGVDPFADGADASVLHSELALRRRDGSAIWCMINGRALDPAAPSKGCVWVISDISDRKRTEAALIDAKHGLERSLAELARQKDNVDLAHGELSAALVSLKQAQDTLLTSEKMASLGALVAGVAHELNTPIGNSLLTASALGDMVGDFERRLGTAGGVKRSTLEAHLADARMACTIITGSLTRAAELINSFKQVAVDQSSGQRRRFLLDEVVRDTLATFAAQLRHAGCEVTVNVPPGLTFDSYPGSVGQVLSNLLNNALLHGFDGGGGTVVIDAWPQQGADGVAEAVLRFRDDGKGMSERTLRQVFDPFFTTKMGQGGSGLGMNIVYNMVTGVLRGRIAIDSAPGEGTCVTLTLPLQAPALEQGAEPRLEPRLLVTDDPAI